MNARFSFRRFTIAAPTRLLMTWCVLAAPDAAWGADSGTDVDEPPALALGVEPLWDQVLVGDPLGFTVRLHSPRARAAADDARAREDGPGGASPVPAPHVPSDWWMALRIRMSRWTDSGTTNEVLSGHAWTDDLTPVFEFPVALAALFPGRSRTFLVAPGTAALVAAHYRLEVAWLGSNHVAPNLLPPDGWLSAEPFVFEPVPAVTESELADHENRLAREALVRGRPAEASRFASASLRRSGALPDPERAELPLLLARSELMAGNLHGLARELDSALARGPAGSPRDLLEQERRVLGILAPRLRIRPPAGLGTGATIELQGLEGERYVTRVSLDLRQWVPIRTNAPGQGTWVWTEPAGGPSARYYQAMWEPDPAP